MVKGIGIDVVNLGRFEKILKRTPKLKLRLFTEREIFSSYSLWNLAGKFAGKEAVLKSVGLGLSGGIRWKDIEILGDSQSPPQVFLSGKAKELLGNYNFLLSISHDEDLVIAVCVALYQGT